MLRVVRGCRKSWDVNAGLNGGEPGIIAGALAIMLGSDEVDFNQAKSILEKISKNITSVGSLGAGQTTKLVNQILVGINIMLWMKPLRLQLKNLTGIAFDWCLVPIH